MSEMELLKQRIAALESTLAAKKAEDKEEETEDTKLAAEIRALEARLASDDDDEDEDDDEEDEKAEEKKASEVDPKGIEEEITQDRFTEVERLEHGTELADGPSIGAVAPTKSEYVARLKQASVRLDKVAEYLENNGRRALAFRIDKIADAIDARINGGK